MCSRGMSARHRGTWRLHSSRSHLLETAFFAIALLFAAAAPTISCVGSTFRIFYWVPRARTHSTSVRRYDPKMSASVSSIALAAPD